MFNSCCNILPSSGSDCIVRHDRILRSSHPCEHRLQQEHDQQGLASVLSHDQKGVVIVFPVQSFLTHDSRLLLCVHIDRVFGMAGRSSSWAIGTQLNFTGQGTKIQLSPKGFVLERLWSHRKVACHHRYCLLKFLYKPTTTQ